MHPWGVNSQGQLQHLPSLPTSLHGGGYRDVSHTVGPNLRLCAMSKAQQRDATREPALRFHSPVPKYQSPIPEQQVPGGRAKPASHTNLSRSLDDSWSQQQEGLLASLTKKKQSRDAAPVCFWRTAKNRNREKHCQKGLIQAAVGTARPQEWRTGRHYFGQPLLSRGCLLSACCCSTRGRRATSIRRGEMEPGLSRSSRELPLPCHGAPPQLLCILLGGGGRSAEPHREERRSRRGGSWHRAEQQGCAPPPPPSRTGCSRSRCPFHRLLPGGIPHAPVCCRPLRLPPRQVLLAHPIPPAPEPSPRAGKPSPERCCLAVTWVFPALAHLCQSTLRETQRQASACSRHQLTASTSVPKGPSVPCSPAPAIHIQRLQLYEKPRDAGTDRKGWTDRTPFDATAFSATLTEGTEKAVQPSCDLKKPKPGNYLHREDFRI